ncbi:GNAT family N-acetyltransferase [Metabacillus sp. RGM 3146]|uniref:GNAT family N-acetyltransferase n=1 Tax=Metabacillus sp. RGM 3146 TaxID=3401092 RepID=UPI003B9D8278
MEKIRDLKGEREWLEAFQVMKQLRLHLDEEEFLALVKLAEEKEEYQISVLEADHEIVCVIGYMPMITLYYGRYLWVCDLVTDSKHRSKGYGEKLLNCIEERARKKGFDGIALSSAFQRIEAHRFYEEKMGFDKVSYSFKKGF